MTHSNERVSRWMEFTARGGDKSRGRVQASALSCVLRRVGDASSERVGECAKVSARRDKQGMRSSKSVVRYAEGGR